MGIHMAITEENCFDLTNERPEHLPLETTYQWEFHTGCEHGANDSFDV
jgi:hypothetical protein